MAKPYFAYGSNLKLTRVRERAPSATPLSRAHLPGRRLALDKRGRDGTAKANVVDCGESGVWGVLYEIDAVHWDALDGFEGGYERVSVEVVLDDSCVAAQTYVAIDRADDLLPREWYVRLMIEGAREHGLPAEWIALLESLPFSDRVD